MMDRRENSRLRSTSREAAEWFVRLKHGELDAAARHEYLRWLRSSAQNTAEALRIGRLFGFLRGYLERERLQWPEYWAADPAHWHSNIK